MGELTGKAVLIMGAGSPQGQALAAAFSRQGALVAANELSPFLLDETARVVQAAGGTCHPYGYDTAKKMPIQALIGEVVETFGRLDVLVNAGIVMPAAGLLEMDEWDWHRTLDVNLAAAFFTMQVAGRVMRVQGGGAILNLILDPEPLLSMTGRSALAASQSALAALTRLAAAELADYHIRVNAIALGVGAPAASNEAQPPARPGRLAYAPLPITTGLEAVAAQALALCSGSSGNLSGQVVMIDRT